MTCHDFDLLVADHLQGSLDEGDRERMQRHAESCPGCRGELDSLGRVWSLMAEIPDPETRPESAARFEEMLRAFRSGRSSARVDRPGARWSGWLRAAAALVLLSVGVAAGFMMSSGTGGKGSAGGGMYLLMIYEPSDLAQEITPARLARLEAEYDAWWHERAEEGRVLGWLKLDEQGGRLVEGGAGVGDLLPLPGGRAGETLSWVAVVQAEDMERAAALARDCPMLRWGARVEIRPEAPERG